jgi:glycine cleavage system T protein
MNTTPLHDWHVAHGARMTDFAGWDMPLQYPAGPLEEHRLVRASAGLFDTSHMGRFSLAGADAAGLLEQLVSSRMSDLALWQSRYGLLCREDGGILDDLFVYRLPGRWMVVVNASNREKDFAWLQRHAGGLRDDSGELGMIALQGPRAVELLGLAAGLAGGASGGQPHGTDAAAAGRAWPPERFWAAEIRLAGADCLACRTGYTGEDGFELFPPAGRTTAVWELLLATAAQAGIACGPAGLAARDSLRFEPGFALYGHELDESVNPAEAGLLWACDLDKRFIGGDAVRTVAAAGPARRLAAFVMQEKAVPRQGYRVLAPDGRPVGAVVSGMYAPTLDVFAGNAWIEPDFAKSGTMLMIEVRGAGKPARVARRPLYKPAYRM